MMDDQARYVAALAAAIAADHDWAVKQFPDRPRYGLVAVWRQVFGVDPDVAFHMC